MHEILACRMSYPYRYELYKRVDEPSGKERYVVIATFPEKPTGIEINDAFEGKPRYDTLMDLIAYFPMGKSFVCW